jgi:FMN-dependent NADH-azoreductase
MNLFRLDASIRTDRSHSRQIADLVEREWTDAHPESRIVRCHIGTEPLPSDAWATAVFANFTPADQRTSAQLDAVGLAATLVDELVDADALLFAVPLYNFGVSQHFKTYVDLVTTDPRMAAGEAPILAGKPAVLVTVHGGAYGAGTPRQGWDHAIHAGRGQPCPGRVPGSGGADADGGRGHGARAWPCARLSRIAQPETAE